jgi:hypothetical protein
LEKRSTSTSLKISPNYPADFCFTLIARAWWVAVSAATIFDILPQGAMVLPGFAKILKFGRSSRRPREKRTYQKQNKIRASTGGFRKATK